VPCRFVIITAVAALVGCETTIEIPAPRPGDQGSDTGVPGSDGEPGDSAATEDTYDPGDEYVPPPDCGTLDGESDDADLSNGGIMTGTRFCEIYRDIFHHEGSAKCQTLHCHGGEAGQHDLSMGWTLDACYLAMTTYEAKFFDPKQQLVTPRTQGDSFPVSALGRYVAPTSGADAGEAFMPQVKTYLGNRKLNDAEWQRVKGWLERGAPND